MRIAFYAPMKAPDHPVPSGDRELARLFVSALCNAGHVVATASRLRTFDARGDGDRQTRLGRLGAATAQRFLRRCAAGGAPDLWFTYHLHHKAPDVIGPQVSAALDIPYVVAEASVAAKQREGRWAVGYGQALSAIRAADAIVFVNPVDVDGVLEVRRDVAPLILPPFIDTARFAPASERWPSAGAVRLVTVAMMRDGAKLASYRLLAAALTKLAHLPWTLSIVGDGPARESVEAAFAPLAAARVRFIGRASSRDVAAHLHAADVFVWPAVDEAFGMALLEAQASGLPVVAGDSAGVANIVERDGSGLLVAAGDADAFAAGVQHLVVDADLRRRLASRAPRYVRERHDLAVASSRLDALLHGLVAARHPARPPAATAC